MMKSNSKRNPDTKNQALSEKDATKPGRIIWILFLAIIIPLGILTWKFNHEIFLAINGFLDGSLLYPMLFLSAMADGLFVIMIASAFYRKKKGLYWAFLAAFIVSAIIVQVIKNNYHTGRPLKYYSADKIFHAGDILKYQSFPSGHSTTALVLARYLMEIAVSRRIKAAFLTFGILCALSRIFIGVHFPLDVLAGSLIGFFTTQFFIWIAKKRVRHVDRPEYRYNPVLIALAGLIAAVSYVIFQSERYAPLSTPVTILAVMFGIFFLHHTIQEFFKIFSYNRTV